MIFGAKKGQHTPVETKDTVQTSGTAYVTVALCEGEISGLVNGPSSVFLDEVAIHDGVSFTWPTISWSEAENFRKGSHDQTKLGDRFCSSNVPVKLPANRKLRANKPAISWISTSLYPDVIGLKLNIRFGNFYKVEENGDINPTSVSFLIEIATNGGPFVTYRSVHVYEKSSGGFLKSFDIDLPRDKSRKVNSWKISVKRTTPDSVNSKITDSFELDSIIAITGNKYRYPHTVVSSIKLDALNFPSLPQLSYHLRLKKVKIPSNYSPTVYDANGNVLQPPSYSGFWDGTFKSGEHWTDNPVWIYNDLVTNKRYGLGQYVSQSQIDKWSLYAISKHCDEMVPNGEDGTGLEPRFTANFVLTKTEEAISVISQLASIFRGVNYWLSNQIYLSQDRPKSIKQGFVNSNVIDGKFSYSSSEKSQRRTVAIVKWNNPDDFYRPNYEHVHDEDGILKYGFREKDFDAFGCCRRSQAITAGKYALLSERLETEFVNFKVGHDGLSCRPGDLIQVYDDFKTRKRYGGRILDMSSGKDRVWLDRNVEVISGLSYEISLVIPKETLDSFYTGTYTGLLVTGGNQIDLLDYTFLETRPITAFGYSGSNHYVDLTSGFSEKYVGGIWSINAGTVQSGTIYGAKKYRILSIKEDAEEKTLEIVGLQYAPEKFGLAETGFTVISEPKLNYSGAFIAPPTNLILTENTQYDETTEFGSFSIDGTFTKSTGEYLFSHGGSGRKWESGNGGWEILNISNSGFRYPISATGIYEFKVWANQIGGAKSSLLTGSILAGAYSPYGTGEDSVIPMSGFFLENEQNGNWLGFSYQGKHPVLRINFSGSGTDGSDSRSVFLESVGLKFRDASGNLISQEKTIDSVYIPYSTFVTGVISGWPRRVIDIEAYAKDIWGNKGKSFRKKYVNFAPPAVNLDVSVATPNWFSYSLEPQSGTIDAKDFSGVLFWIGSGEVAPERPSQIFAVSNTFGASKINHSLNTTGSLWAWCAVADTFSAKESELNISGPFQIGGGNVTVSDSQRLTLSGHLLSGNSQRFSLYADWDRYNDDTVVGYDVLFSDQSGNAYPFYTLQTDEGKNPSFHWTYPIPEKTYSYKVRANTLIGTRTSYKSSSPEVFVPKEIVGDLDVEGTARFRKKTFVDSYSVSISAGGNNSVDFGVSNIIILECSNSATSTILPTNIVAGATYIIVIKRISGSGLIQFGTGWHFPDGSEPSVPTDANSVHIISAVAYDTSKLNAVYSENFAQP